MFAPLRPTLATALAALIVAHGSSAAADECTERFVPDRPGAVDNHATVSPGCGLFEGGVDVGRENSSETISFPLLFRVGLHRVLELRASTDTVRILRRDSDDTGLPDDTTEVEAPAAGIGLKIMAVEARDNLPGLGLLVFGGSVTNSRFVDELTAKSALLFDWPFVDSLQLSLNPGIHLLARPSPADSRLAAFSLPAYFGWTLPAPVDWMTLFVDGTGAVAFRDGSSWEQSVGGGLAFLVTEGFQLDAFVSGVATGDVHPITVGAGASAGF